MCQHTYLVLISVCYITHISKQITMWETTRNCNMINVDDDDENDDDENDDEQVWGTNYSLN
jgi:hypothetical protein